MKYLLVKVAAETEQQLVDALGEIRLQIVSPRNPRPLHQVCTSPEYRYDFEIYDLQDANRRDESIFLELGIVTGT